MIVTYAMMAVILVAAPVVLAFVLRGINRMSRNTRHGIRVACILKATGTFVVFLSILDYLFAALGVWNDQPYAWPWLLLGGVAILFMGMAAMHLTTRRTCHCPECPIRRAMTAIDAEGLQ